MTSIIQRFYDWLAREEKLRFARIVHQQNIQINYLRQRFEAEEAAKLQIKKYSAHRIRELARELDVIERRNVHAVKFDDSHKRLKSDLHHAHNTIGQIRKEHEKTKKILELKIQECGVCKTCNPQQADEMYNFNHHGGIIHK